MARTKTQAFYKFLPENHSYIRIHIYSQFQESSFTGVLVMANLLTQSKGNNSFTTTVINKTFCAMSSNDITLLF